MQPNPQTKVFKDTITKVAGSIVLWQGSMLLFLAYVVTMLVGSVQLA